MRRLGLTLGLLLLTATAHAQTASRFENPFAPDMRRLRVIDADSFVYRGEHYRVYGIDGPEMTGCEAPIGRRVKAFVEQTLQQGKVTLSHALNRRNEHMRDKYGRILAKVFVNRQDLGQLLITRGFAHPYTGGNRAPWPCG